MDTITISIRPGEIFGDRPSGIRHYLYLDPEAREVSTWSCVGAGTPEPVWHHRAVTVKIPLGVGSDGLRDWLEGELEAVDALFARYRGSEWDGSNHIGRWEPLDDAWAVSDVELDLQDKLAIAELPCHWDAGDYLCESEWTDVEMAQMISAEGRAKLADTIITDAPHEVLLDRDDLIEYLEDRAAELLEELG